MKAEIRDAWADALESDEYKQGYGTLTGVREDGTEEDCCLGVLSKLAVKAGVIPEPVQIFDGFNMTLRYGIRDEDDSGTSTLLLPLAVMEWAGLDVAAPELTWEDQDIGMDVLNDDKELTFAQLAPLIREQL